jgi:hypothetical protein
MIRLERGIWIGEPPAKGAVRSAAPTTRGPFIALAQRAPAAPGGHPRRSR